MAEPVISGELVIRGDGAAAEHARDLLPALAPILADARATAPPVDLTGTPEALDDWARSGAMILTGAPDGPPQAATGRPASAVRAALALARSLIPAALGLSATISAGRIGKVALPAPPWPDVALLGERAAIAGLSRQGAHSCGGALRILPCRTGNLAISLARPDDHELISALISSPMPGDSWAALAAWCAGQPVDEAVERAQLLGLPAAAIPEVGAAVTVQDRHRAARSQGAPWLLTTPGGRRPYRDGPPLVVDLSALWAGPLTAHLLGLAGAQVVKVESPRRPDGARFGSPGFYDLLHFGVPSVALDPTTPEGSAALRDLIRRADVVLESSRPRALRQLGIEAEQVVAEGTTWLSITAQGRSGPWSNRVGFGDDVALGAGLHAAQTIPAGDAIADPLTGVHAAVAAIAALGTGRAWLLDVSMHHVTALSALGGIQPHALTRVEGGWLVETASGRFPVSRPRARTAPGPAAALGAHTSRFVPGLR